MYLVAMETGGRRRRRRRMRNRDEMQMWAAPKAMHMMMCNLGWMEGWEVDQNSWLFSGLV